MQVRVRDVVVETADACSFVLDVPTGFAYRPGQFLTVRVGEAARSYSLSSSPHLDEPPKITVKRTSDGYASNWLCDNIRSGTVLRCLAPAGAFTPRSLDADLLMLAGGSGITPVISIVKSVLAAGQARVVLVYANRDEASVIFAAELRALAAAHPGRLAVVHWLESVQGVPTRAQLRVLAEPFAGYAAFVCGPAPFMDEVTHALRDLGVPRTHIHVELFQSLTGDPFAEAAADFAEAAPSAADSGEASTVLVELDGERHEFDWPPHTKLLDLLLDRGLDAPFSCREGSCGACTCRVEDGEVKMLRNEVLDEQDLAEGYALACQSLPLSPAVTISYT